MFNLKTLKVMKKYFIGIDISNETLDVCVIKGKNEQLIVEFKVENAEHGMAEALKKIKQQKISLNDAWFCYEHTGIYGILLTYTLDKMNVGFSAVPAYEIKHSLGLVRGKNDKVDAKRIAEYACRNQNKLMQSKFPGEAIFKLKQLLTYRNQLVKISVQLQNSFKAFRIASKTMEYDFITDNIKRQILEIKETIGQVQNEIMGIIKQNDEIYNNYKMATSVNGIGPIIAFYAIVHTVNFTSFENSRKFNCYAGIAPFGEDSGTSIHTQPRVSNLANKRLKALLYNGANSAIKSDPELKQYYNRKREEGKDHQLIMNAIACKLSARMFAVVKRKTPYVSLFSQNFSKK